MDGPEAAPDAHLPAPVKTLSEPSSVRSDPRQSGIVLSVIVVTHNSSKVIGGLIASLANHPPAVPWELIVFDNNSDEAVEPLFMGLLPKALLIHSPENRGFAAGVNAAAGHANGAWLLLANPDISWEQGVPDRLIQFLEDHPHAAAVSPRLVFPDGRSQMSIRRFPNHANIWFSRGAPWGALTGSIPKSRAYTLPDPEEPAPVEAVSAACLLIRAEAFHAVGGMDSEFFLYVEDTDLCRRLNENGWEIWLDSTTTVTHRWGGAVKRDPKLKKYHRQSMRRYFRMHHADQPVRNAILFAALAMGNWWDCLMGEKSHARRADRD